LDRRSRYGWAIDDVSMRELAPLLEFIPNLGGLRLCDNKIGDGGMAALSQRLPLCVEELTSQSALVTLELLGNHIGDAGIAALGAVLPELPELQELYLQNNRFREIGPLVAALPVCENLKDLQMGGNRITCDGAEALARVLEACCNRPTVHSPGLSVLGLSGNKIDNHGARALASVLPRCRRLRKLMLKMNSFKEQDGHPSQTVPVSATVRVNDSQQVVITSKCKGGNSRVEICRVNPSGERAQSLLGTNKSAAAGGAQVVQGEGNFVVGHPGELIGAGFERCDFGSEPEEIHIVLDTPSERFTESTEPRTPSGDVACLLRPDNLTGYSCTLPLVVVVRVSFVLIALSGR
jgi:hypothetical protein